MSLTSLVAQVVNEATVGAATRLVGGERHLTAGEKPGDSDAGEKGVAEFVARKIVGNRFSS